MAKAGRSKRNGEEKKRRILRAAARVFAEKGFPRCRITDIAREAGVAYGLVYHYFKNKEELLNTIFEENWGLLNDLLQKLASEPISLREKIYQVFSFILDAHRNAPDVMQVMVIEVARSAKLLDRPKLATYEKSFSRLAEILSQHQTLGEVRSELDCRLLAYCFFGIIELVLTGYQLKMMEPFAADRLDSLKEQLTEFFLRGIAKG